MQPNPPGQEEPYGQSPGWGPGSPGQPGATPPGYPGQPGGTPPGYPGGSGVPGGQPPNNTLGLVAMIMGIAAIPLTCCYIGIPLGIAAAVTGFLGKKKADSGLATNRGQAMAGLICGIVAVVLGIALVLLSVVFRTIDLPTNYGN